jgi:hypothetical protein
MGWTTSAIYDSRIGVDYSQVYFPKRVGSKKDLPKRTEKSLFRIVNSEFGWNDVGCGDYFKYTLKLDLVKAENKNDEPHYPFLFDGMGPVLGFLVNIGATMDPKKDPRHWEYGPLEWLHGKEVYGYMLREKELKKRKKYAEYGAGARAGVIEAIALKGFD